MSDSRQNTDRTIPFDRNLARALQRELSSLMYRYVDTDGRTMYECDFCAAWTYGPTHKDPDLLTIKHFPDCLGEKLLKELDAKLAYE